MWNPFKKSSKAIISATGSNQSNQSNVQQPKNMGMLQRLAMKKLMSMSEQERQQMISKFMAPDNLAKNKDKIIAQMEQMKNSGMITESQYEEGKKRLGI